MGLCNNLNTNLFEMVSVAPANPGANVLIFYTVPANQRLEVIGISFQYVIANLGLERMILVAGNDTVVDFQASPLADGVAINQTLSLHFSTNVDARDHEATHNLLTGKLSTQLFLNQGDRLVAIVNNWNAADELRTIRIRAKAWIVE
jgi:hypothetical protein